MYADISCRDCSGTVVVKWWCLFLCLSLSVSCPKSPKVAKLCHEYLAKDEGLVGQKLSFVSFCVCSILILTPIITLKSCSFGSHLILK